MPHTVSMSSEEKIPHVFGQIVLRERKARGLSRYKLAAIAPGLTENRLYRIEHGWNEPKIRTIILVAEGLGMEPKDLFHELYLALTDTLS